MIINKTLMQNAKYKLFVFMILFLYEYRAACDKILSSRVKTTLWKKNSIYLFQKRQITGDV